MLKRLDHGPGAEDDRSIGELIGRLLHDGKSYAQAEFDLVKVRVEGEVDRYKRAAILFGVAIALGLAALVAVAVTLVIALARFIGPIAGGALAILLFAGGAVLVARAAINSIEAREDD